MKVGYEFTVAGEYKGSGADGKAVKRFFKDEVFYLPETVSYVSGREYEETVVNGRIVKKTKPKIVKSNALRCAQHVLLRYHLPFRLKEKYDDFIKVRTFELTKKKKVQLKDALIPDVSKMKIEDMTESELRQFCVFKDLNVTLEGYGDLADKKMAVEQAWKIKQKENKAIKQSKSPETVALTEPNMVGIIDDTTTSSGTLSEDEDPMADLL